MTKVICLIGASGSGKTTVAKALEKARYNIIQSYTTRQPREENEWGHTFIDEGGVAGWVGDVFKTVDWLDAIGVEIEFHKKDMIAYFNSYNLGHHYFATDDQVVRGKANIYIVDPEGAEMVHEFYKGSDIEVITVYLQVDEVERFTRMEIRGYKNKETMHENIEQVRSRIYKDRLLFQTVKCDYVVDGNQDLDRVVDLVRDVI